MRSLYEILDVLFPRIDLEEVDLINTPFQIKMKNKEEMAEIKVYMTNQKMFNDNIITQAIYALNKFLPYNAWTFKANMLEREIVFIGKNHPPKMAKYQGSELRPWNWIPMGVSEDGEIGWNLGAKSKNMGNSMYIYDDGRRAVAMDIPKTAQGLTVGATGGGKAIWIHQEVYT